MTEELCRCGSGADFTECCAPIIGGSKNAPSPEALMRARFTAHCKRNYTFLVDSTHPDHREGVTEEEIANWASHVEWTTLEIESASLGESEDKGFVSFTAGYTIKDVPQSLTEDSEFLKVNDQWFYVDGKVHGQEPYMREAPRVGRNEPCPCGSGKKFKKCCGK